VEGYTTLITAVPLVFVYSYKVPRRPFGSARLDAELKVRTVDVTRVVH
jgi:hypothetical protein